MVQPGDNLVEVILDAAERQGLRIEDGAIIAIASKALATAQKRLRKLSTVKPSRRARNLAARYNLEPAFVEIVLQEAEEVCGGVSKALLTLKDNVLTANAGVDQKNSPVGYAVLWPRNPFQTAEKIREDISQRTGKRVGILIVDSRVTPLRMGTSGLALAAAGFEPVRDYRVEKDLYGRSISITRHALADDLASAAHLVMGESNERTPAVLITQAPVKLVDKIKRSSVAISTKECLFANRIMQKNVKECP
jgi:coenzyme F420-0:L-glutamate ligase